MNSATPRRAALLSIPALAAAVILWSAADIRAAERWKEVPGGTAQSRILYDPDSVIPSGPDRFRVRVAGFDAGGFPRKSVEEYDCRNRIVRDVEVVVEKPGKPVSHSLTPSEWRDAPRDTPRGKLLKTLCR